MVLSISICLLFAAIQYLHVIEKDNRPNVFSRQDQINHLS